MNSYDDIQIEDVYADLPDDADECLRMLARHGIDESQPAPTEEQVNAFIGWLIDDRDYGDADPDYTHPDANDDLL